MKDWINFLLGTGSALEISPRPIRNRFGRHLFGDSIEDDIRSDVEQIGRDMKVVIYVAVKRLPHDDRSDSGVGPDGAGRRIGESADRPGGLITTDEQIQPEKGQTTFSWIT